MSSTEDGTNRPVLEMQKGKRVKNSVFTAVIGAATLMAIAVTGAVADESTIVTDVGPFKLEDGAIAGAKKIEMDGGKWFGEESGAPTYRVSADGKVDFLTYRGFQRYHAECHVCHGPEGLGSTYAPALVESVKTMTYDDFVGVVASGQIRNAGGTEYVMPALGDNKNVMCYLDGMYTYLKARAADAIPRGRPKLKESKPKELGQFENDCIAG
ncbi:MAG: c-type cytochrome, methanol metabolism-related [Pseudomonadota bacterium]